MSITTILNEIEKLISDLERNSKTGATESDHEKLFDLQSALDNIEFGERTSLDKNKQYFMR